ncbi:TPA: hypothetical protein HA278_05625 [Candidatus Woesearchaeota archaeon]|nr:hypothetical protein [archaeon]HIJ11509.1 hypothetical protein [Candidatus Woesearchaeota archaeon]|tara:strand:- start:728 stop:1705 length:978 start_codon:yes stop_codon:yes gene_type:complete
MVKSNNFIREHTGYFATLVVVVAATLILSLVTNGDGITGQFSLVDLAPKSFTFSVPDNVSLEEASFALDNSREDINILRTANVRTQFVEDALREAETAFEQENYVQVLHLTSLIEHIRKDAIELQDGNELLKRNIHAAEEEGVSMEGFPVMMQSIDEAIYELRLDEGHRLMFRAEAKLDEATRESSRLTRVALLSKNFVVRYWWQIILVLIILAILARPAYRKMHKKMLKRKVAKLKKQMAFNKEMIKSLQRRAFVDANMSTSTYKEKAAAYETKIAEIRHTIPVLEAEIAGKKIGVVKQKKGVIKIADKPGVKENNKKKSSKKK